MKHKYGLTWYGGPITIQNYGYIIQPLITRTCWICTHLGIGAGIQFSSIQWVSSWEKLLATWGKHGLVDSESIFAISCCIVSKVPRTTEDILLLNSSVSRFETASAFQNWCELFAATAFLKHLYYPQSKRGKLPSVQEELVLNWFK